MGASCTEPWRELVGQHPPAEEQKRARRFAQCARTHELRYSLSLRDRASGAKVPIAELSVHRAPISVQLTLERDGQYQVLQWDPRSIESVYPLLME